MSYRGRRTQGPGDSSAGKSARASRIAQPVRRPSLRQRSFDRNSVSADQLNNVAYLSASAAKRNRSSSATPMRTPNRPILHPGVNALMTSEKERMPLDDKRFLQTQATRVTEYLHGNEDLGKEFLQRGGLKSMSTKQFVAICSHLLKFIVGNRLSIGTNYVDDIVSVLTHIEYPYAVNKSWLKTPSAPHAFNNMIVLFGWLLDFVPRLEAIEEMEADHLQVDDDFPDKKYAQRFISSARVGFSLWNNSKNDEFNHLKQELTNNFIEGRVQMDEIKSSLEGLDAYITQLDVELGSLSKLARDDTKKFLALEKEYKQLEEQIIRKKNSLSHMEKICNENQLTIQRLEDSSENRQRQITETQCRIDCIEVSIKAQRMTTNERAELINQVQYLKQLLDSNKKMISQLQDKYDSQQVLYSRLMKRTLDTVSTFNTRLHQLFADQDDIISMKIEELCLDRNSDVALEEQLERVLPLIDTMKRSAFQKAKIYTQKISDLERELKKAVYEHDTLLDKQLKETRLKCEEYSRELEKLDEQIVNTTGHLCKEVERASQSLKKQIALNGDFRDKIAAHRGDVDKKKENEEIFELITAKLEAYLLAKKRNVELTDESVKQLWQALEEVNLKLKDID